MDNEKRGACHEPSANVRRFRQTVISKSEADNFEEARWEWHVVKCYDASACDPSMPAERCICGHEPIIECFVLLNRLNGNVLDPVGNVCVRQFRRDDMDDVVRTLHDVHKLRSAFELLGDDEELPIKRFESTDNRAPLTRRAVFGCNPISERMAAAVPCLARSSSTRPVSTNVTIITDAS